MRLKQPSIFHSPAAWILTRKIIQYLALLAFIVVFIAAHNSDWSPALLNLPMRLDPLLMLAHLLSSRIFLVSSLLALLTLFLALIFGRAWCGWLCPLGTVLDLFTLKRWRSRRQPPPDSLASDQICLTLCHIHRGAGGESHFVSAGSFDAAVSLPDFQLMACARPDYYRGRERALSGAIPFHSGVCLRCLAATFHLSRRTNLFSFSPAVCHALSGSHCAKPVGAALLVPLSLSPGRLVGVAEQSCALSPAGCC